MRMPQPVRRKPGATPVDNLKTGTSEQRYKFANAGDIERGLESQDEAGLVAALTALRNQLTVKHDESPLSANDERILLVKSWLEVSSGARRIFDIWENASLRQMSLTALLINVLSSVLTLLSSHYLYHGLAQPILKTLLSSQWSQRLNSYLGGSHNELLLVTLKMFNSMSTFAGGRERRNVFEVFAWETKSLLKLLHMRRKGKPDFSADIIARPDIRTLFVLFLLSFVDNTTASATKAAFLEQRRDTFGSLFKGLYQDQHVLIRRVLEVCWTGIWLDPKVPRTAKIALFNESVLAQLTRIYERAEAEDNDPEHVPADVVHHFLLAICTHPGIGVCFRDKGWYPRELDTNENVPRHDDEMVDNDTPRRCGRVHNKILANVLRSLKVNEDLRQQELALKILSSCPELVSGYWSSASLTLEPRLSSKWLTNIAFFGSVISLPVPEPSFLLSDGRDQTSYQPVPPPLNTVVENILPSVNIKTHLSRGLQSSSGLVRHCSALALAKCLLKYQAVVGSLEVVGEALEEDEEGLWHTRRRELEREVRRRVPDFQVIVAFSQRSNEAASTTPSVSNSDTLESIKLPAKQATNDTQSALLSESAQRLLWLYHRSLPMLVAEARFDVGKLLAGFQHGNWSINASGSSTILGFDALRQLHTLRLLGESEQFNWAGKTGSSSNFHVLLRLYTVSESSATREAISSLLRRVLSQSLLFQHHADEVSIWLESLPHTIRYTDARAPDGSSLTDEKNDVITFLDGCAQRCAKTPHLYIEELENIVPELIEGDENSYGETISRGSDDPRYLPSPLVMTVLEQLNIKMRGRLLSDSHTLSIVTFVRMLIQKLSSKVLNLGILSQIAGRVVTIVRPHYDSCRDQSLPSGIMRELGLMGGADLTRLQSYAEDAMGTGDVTVEEFLAKVEDLPTSVEPTMRLTLAYQLIDWFRLVELPIRADITRLFLTLENLSKRALEDFIRFIKLDQHSIWICWNNEVQIKGLMTVCAAFCEDILPLLIPSCRFDFEVLLFHASADVISDSQSRQILADSLTRKQPTLFEMQRAAMLVVHRLPSHGIRDPSFTPLMMLLASVISAARATLNRSDVVDLIRYVFRLEAVRGYLTDPLPSVIEAGREILMTTFSSPLSDIADLLAEYSHQWAMNIKERMGGMTDGQSFPAGLWLKFMTQDDLLSLLDHLTHEVVTSQSDPPILLVDDLVKAIIPLSSSSPRLLTSRRSGILALSSSFPRSHPLQKVVAISCQGMLALCHDGLPMGHIHEGKLFNVVAKAQDQWPPLAAAGPDTIDVHEFLATERWSHSTVDIVTGQLYMQSGARDVVMKWLHTQSPAECAPDHLARVIYCLLDAGSSAEEGDVEFFVPHFSRIIRAIALGKTSSYSIQGSASCTECVIIMLRQLPSIRPSLLSALHKESEVSGRRPLSPQILDLVGQLARLKIPSVTETIDSLVDAGLRWAAPELSGGSDLSEEQSEVLRQLTFLLPYASTVKSHLAEPVVTAIIDGHLSHYEVLCLLQKLFETTRMKPATVNRFLQNIVQRPDLFTLCALITSDSSATSPRDAIILVLHTLFHLHPTNTCQATHVEPLVRLYAGSLAEADRKLLSIFQLFETTRKASVAGFFSYWSSTQGIRSSSSLDAIQSLDPSRIFKTCLTLPRMRRSQDSMWQDHDLDRQLYDPTFVVLLFAQMLAAEPPSSALGWVQTFRTNVVSLLICEMSAKDNTRRTMAISQLAALYKKLQEADIQEKSFVTHILDLVRDALPSPGDGDAPRLPAYTTLLFAHALRGVFYPAYFIYPLTARFLLQRPVFDTGDVPMLFGMLYSSSDQWKKERAWMIRLLADGMVGGDEWRVLKRRHTWDLLASLLQSESRDANLRRGILEFLANVTCHTRATTSLILKSSLLSWIELQLRGIRDGESLAWARILENILVVADFVKLETSTSGEWRSILARCLMSVLDSADCNTGGFCCVVQATLRLSLLPGRPVTRLPSLLARALRWLKAAEGSLIVPVMNRVTQRANQIPPTKHRLPPYHAHVLFRASPAVELADWGECTEALWRIAMTADGGREMREAWDELTPRMLVWRSLVGQAGSEMGEWVRKEVGGSILT
ncbi:uncharacterized protein FIBRA_02553 [Fibroporia radiculosa]|uniref:Nucleolar pre-ribosomal-associated protein 1 C-terminal domain-containing protein n=1 Tax=Fibroporia radiculosa TaxID=599839 RepID=J4H1X2_9APHY|nr:uncharacterized protein FIBRA_02553 [Fibroporia radiculosa]CCM00519.1 predicted protein [Fibroporia radiculosa]